MTNIKTNIRGIVRNTPDSETDMGSAQEIINMRNKDGAWRPIGKKKRLTGSVQVSNNNKQIGWYHHPSNVDTTVISFDTVSKKILVHDTLLGTNVIVKKRDGSDFVLPSDEDFNCFTHLENILVLLGTVDRYNFLWINGAFEFIEFGGIDWTCEKGTIQQIDLMTDGISYEASVAGLNTAWNSLLPVAVADYIQKRSEGITSGYIEGICAFRLAIELFDGSFSWYSDVKILRATGVDRQTSFTHTVPDTVPCLFENTYHVDIIGFANVVAAYVKLLKFTQYMPVIQYEISDALKYYFRNKTIKAIHVCATKPIYPKISENLTDYFTSYLSDSDQNLVKRYNIKSDVVKPESFFISDLSAFKSVFSTTIENGFKVPSLTEIFAFSNFETNMDIPVDNFTGNKTSAKHSFVYNKRLHLQQISNSLPIIADVYNNYSFQFEKYIITTGYSVYFDIIIPINNQYFVVRKLINFDLWKKWITFSPQLLDNNSVYISREVYYNHSSAEYCRLSFSKDGVSFYKLKTGGRIDMVNMPSLNLSKAKVEANQFTNEGIEFDYSDKNTTDTQKDWWQYDNTRFLILSVPVSGVDYATHSSCELCTELPSTYIDTNRLQLSEQSNPLVLPASNSYRFGDINNEVNGVEVTHEQLSETRFGEYPLYVFTKQGVFALLSGSGSTVYSSLDYLKKHKVTDNKTIINVKDYALFRTDKGFFVVAGRDFQELSTQVSGSYTIDIQNDTKFQSLLDGFLSNSHNHLSIKDMIDNDDFISCHEHIEDELWLSLTNSIDASYVFNFKTKSWFKSAETFQYFVNLSPDVIGIKESVVSNVYKYDFYDMHSENNFADLKLFVSRPITFGSTYYKRMEHFVSRLRMEQLRQSGQTVLSTKFYLYGSINGFEYKLLQGGEISDNNLQDQEIRRCFVDFKYLIIVLGFNHEYCEVIGFESEIKEKFKTKLR